MDNSILTALIDKSKQVSKLIFDDPAFKKSEISNELEKRHINPFSDYSKFDFSDVILVLGLNPSSGDIDFSGEVADCHLLYVPESNMGQNDNVTRANLNSQRRGYAYTKYFKTPVELFLNLGYHLCWYNKEFLKVISRRLNLKDNETNYLVNSYKDTGKYLIFSDIMNIKELKSNNIKVILDNGPDIKAEVINLFLLQIDFFMPRLVLINSAYASHLICSQLEFDANSVSEINYKGIPVLFTSMLTGVRALDKFNFNRLRADIARHLNGK